MILRTNPSKVSIPLRTKIALIIFGFFLFLILLEAGLRLGGFMILSLQEYRNLQSIKHKGAYRIICLGESTTAGQWPPYLEEILSQCHTGIHFSVIDKGVNGINTSIILIQLESNLTQYHPDMVVAMMGTNDWGSHIPHEAVSTSKIVLFLKSFRTYKLIRLLRLHILAKAKEEDLLKKALEMNPKNDRAYIELRQLNRTQGKRLQAEDIFKKALELNPHNDDAYVGLGWVYRDQGKLSQAEELLRQAIVLNPKNERAYIRLGWVYQTQGKFSQAEDAFKKALTLNPRNAGAYIELGKFYRSQGKLSQAEGLLKQTIKLNPKNSRAYADLGKFYRSQGKLSQAEDAFKRAIELDPQDDGAYGALSVIYGGMSKPELAEEYDKKAKGLRLRYYNPSIADNYRKLKEVLDKRGIKLVCVQYPMRSIEPLRMIFENDEERIIFVDNEKIFRDAVKKDGYNAYFRDMFAGDFGHCTAKGNRLLAENIADVMLKEVFK